MAFALASKYSSPLPQPEIALLEILHNTDEEVDENEEPSMRVDASALDMSMEEEV